MKRFKTKDLFTIPNIICYIRILLIPIFIYIYTNAKTNVDYYLATSIVIFSSFTDLFDGWIARKFNQVTDLGKILDPVADKLTHAALALCLAFRYPFMWILIFVMIIKEAYMAYMGLECMKVNKMMNGAMWYGKVCTAFLFIVLIILFALPSLDIIWVNTLIFITILIMAFTLIQYIQFYKDFKQDTI